jgi:hypothetical protein
MKSIRVLKGMQQCEDFAPPPEPSGQRKQMAALCMLQRTERQGRLRRAPSRVSPRRSGPEMHSEEFHELSRTCFACSRLALKHYYTKQLRRTHKPVPLCGPMHSFSAPSPSKLVVSRSLLRCDRITYQRLCTDGGSNSMTGASEVDVVGIEEVQVRLQRRVQELQMDRVRVCSAQCVQRSMRRPSVSRVLPCMCDVSPSAARQERSRTKSRIC